MNKRVGLFWIGIIVVVFTTGAGLFKNDFFEIAKQIEIFTEAYKRVNMNYVDEVDPAKLMDTAIKSMFEELDPYTNFWDAQQVQEGQLLNSESYTDIGLALQAREENLLIKQIFKDSPADKAELKAGDLITHIGDTPVADFPENTQELLRGSPGTEVSLTFQRQGKTQKVTLKRARMHQKFVPYYNLTGEVGYIKLSEFGQTAAQEVGSALRDLKSNGAKQIILDLRNNPGGLLEEAIKIVNFFVPKGEEVVFTRSSIEKYNKTYMTQKNPIDEQIPLAILINAHSASASEIVSGSIQDLDRGVIIGARSFGKGLVQRVLPLSYGTQMKLTISRYYTPSGRGIQALDYRHRDPKGEPLLKQEEGYREFTTRNGRKVDDSGGIKPDIAMESAAISEITQALLNRNIIFDFATQYFYDNPLAHEDDFEIPTNLFDMFKTYLETRDFHYETSLENELEQAFAKEANPNLKKEIASTHQQLLVEIHSFKEKELNQSKAQIEQQLTAEILKQYFYEEGLYAYNLKHDSEVKKAIETLQDPQSYTRLLGK